MDAGYSGKPLADKLGLRAGMGVLFVNAPEGYVSSLNVADVSEVSARANSIDFIQLFVRERVDLEARLPALARQLTPNGMLWVSWPKKSAAKKLGIATDVTEDVIRDVALPIGFVDVKVCAADEVWSGLKLVIRKELR